MVVVVMGDHYLRLAIVIPRGLHKGEDLVRTLATFVTARPQWSRGGGWRERVLRPGDWGNHRRFLHIPPILTRIKYTCFTVCFAPHLLHIHPDLENNSEALPAEHGRWQRCCEVRTPLDKTKEE